MFRLGPRLDSTYLALPRLGALPCLAVPCLAVPYLALSYITLPYTTHLALLCLARLTLPLALPYLTLPCLNLPCLTLTYLTTCLAWLNPWYGVQPLQLLACQTNQCDTDVVMFLHIRRILTWCCVYAGWHKLLQAGKQLARIFFGFKDYKDW